MIQFSLFSVYSVFTALILFTFFTCICCWASRKAGWSALQVVGAGTVLIVMRCLLPLEMPFAHIVAVSTLFPDLCEWLGSPLIGDIKVWMPFIFVWIAVSAVLLARLGIALYRQSKLIREVQIPKDSHTCSVYLRTAEKLSCPKTGIIGVSPEFSTAMLAGIFSPHILLPERFQEFSDEQLEFVFRHEITHFLNHDQPIKLCMQIFQHLLWWNPAVYFLRKMADRLLEMRCDQRVCRDLSPSERSGYAKTLLSSIKRHPKKEIRILAVGYAQHGKQASFKHRFEQILKGSDKKKRRGLSVLIISLMVIVFLASYTFVIQPGGHAPMVENQLDVDGSEWITAFILRYDDGTLEVYKDNLKYGTVSPELSMQEPYSSLPVFDVQISEEDQV